MGKSRKKQRSQSTPAPPPPVKARLTLSSPLPWGIAGIIGAAVLSFSNAPDAWRVWGFNGLADVSLAVQVIWIAAALGIGLGAVTLLQKVTAETKTDLIVLGLIALFLAITVIFPAVTRLRGDGQMMVNSLVKGGIEYERTLILNWIMVKLILRTHVDPIAAFKVIAFMAALIYCYALYRFSRRFHYDGVTRIFVILAGLFTGSFPIFAGLVEYYSLTQALMALALVLALEAMEEDRFPIAGLLTALLAATCHFKAVVLLPAFAFALTPKIGRKTALTAFIVICVVGFTAGFIFARRNLLWPLGPVPDDGYTVWSLRHLIDMVNLAVWATPALVVSAVLFFKRDLWADLCNQPVGLFLLTATLGAVAFVFLFSPDLGVARDADLLSLYAIPLTFLLFWLIARVRWAFDARTAGAVVFAGLITVGAQVQGQNDETRSVARHIRQLERDPLRAAYGWEVLGVYYRWKQDLEREKQAFIKALETSPNGRYYMRVAQIESLNRNFAEAEPYARRGAETLQDDPKAQGYCGYVLFSQNKLEEAEPYVAKSIELGTQDVNNFSMMGYIYLSRGDVQKAKAIMTMGMMKGEGHNAQFFCIFGRAEEESGNPETALDYYLKGHALEPRSYWGQLAKSGAERVRELTSHSGQ